MGKAIELQSEGLVSVQQDHARLVERTKKQLSEFASLLESMMSEMKRATEKTVLSYDSKIARLSDALDRSSKNSKNLEKQLLVTVN